MRRVTDKRFVFGHPPFVKYCYKKKCWRGNWYICDWKISNCYWKETRNGKVIYCILANHCCSHILLFFEKAIALKKKHAYIIMNVAKEWSWPSRLLGKLLCLSLQVSIFSLRIRIICCDYMYHSVISDNRTEHERPLFSHNRTFGAALFLG